MISIGSLVLKSGNIFFQFTIVMHSLAVFKLNSIDNRQLYFLTKFTQATCHHFPNLPCKCSVQILSTWFYAAVFSEGTKQSHRALSTSLRVNTRFWLRYRQIWTFKLSYASRPPWLISAICNSWRYLAILLSIYIISFC